MSKNDAKEEEEEEKLLDKFLNTDVGTKWYREKKITEKIPAEAPDFLLKTEDNKLLGLEIIDFYVKHNHLDYSRTLTRIGNKLCQKTKKTYGVEISITIDKQDPKIWNSDNWNDFIEAVYNPGFSIRPQNNIFIEKLEELISKNIENIKSRRMIKQWIQVDKDYYQISIKNFPSISSGEHDCHVNNTGSIKFNPYNELQMCINKKNQKFTKYKTRCDKCYLLITVPSNKIGNYYSFDNKIKDYKFSSEFETVFLYVVDENYSCILNT